MNEEKVQPVRVASARNRGRRRQLMPRVVQLSLQLISALSPTMAGHLANRLWFQPITYPESPTERAALSSADRTSLQASGQALAAYVWGSGPSVLLQHGWSGRAAHMAAFAPSLVDAGFQVIALDAPAHGRSAGRSTDLPTISGALRAVGEAFGPVHAIVAHSFGAACALHAVVDEMPIGRLACISPPATLEGLVEKFAAIVGLSGEVADVHRRLLEKRFGTDVWEKFSADYLASKARLPGLVIHDRNDREVPVGEGRSVAAAWTDAKLIETEGLGHRRILSAPNVIEYVTKFILGETS